VGTRLPMAVIVVLVLSASRGLAQENTQDFADWIQRRLAMALTPTIGASTPGKQVETPSISNSSTALVDQTGAPDVVGIAMQFFNLAKDGDGAPASVTLSAFALRTALLGTDPSRPEVYSAGRNWRRLSVTLGRQREDSAAGQHEAHLIGVKVLAWDRRDPTHPDRVRDLQDAVRESSAARQMAGGLDAVIMAIANRLAPRFAETDPDTFLEKYLGATMHEETLRKLTEEDLAAIDALLLERVAPLIQGQRTRQLRTITSLKQAPQLAFSYQAKLGDESEADELAWQSIFDYGVANRINVFVNAAVSRTRPPLAQATFGGRVAIEVQFQLTGGGSRLADLARAQTPLTLSTSYAGVWDDVDTHKFQAKLNIPFPALLKGFSLPVSVTIASRRELVNETEIRRQLGLTIDFSQFQQALRSAAR
jgi:hypothetical protein